MNMNTNWVFVDRGLFIDGIIISLNQKINFFIKGNASKKGPACTIPSIISSLLSHLTVTKAPRKKNFPFY